MDCFPSWVSDTPSWKKARKKQGGLTKDSGLELDGDEVSPERFPLPTLRGRLARCADEIYNGRGISIIRGLRPSRYSAEENTMLFLALAEYIGDQRGIQSYKGAMLSITILASLRNVVL